MAFKESSYMNYPAIEQQKLIKYRTNSKFFKYHLLPGETYLNQEERRFAFEIAYRHPVVRSALDKLSDDLTKNGLMFMQNKEVLNISFEFEELINKYLVPCLRESVFSIAAQGVLPLYVTEDKKTGQKFTICPHYDTYLISVRYVKGSPIFRFWWIANIPFEKPLMDYVDKRVNVVSGFGFDPNIDGKLNSLISSLFSTVSFMDNMLIYATKAEEQNTDPTMIIQTPLPKSGNIENSNMNIPFDLFVDSNPTKIEEEDKYYQQDLQARFGVQQVTNDVESAEYLQEKFGGTHTVTASIRNRLTLQQGQTVGNRQMPHPRTDLVHLINISKETVSQLFKIPQEVFTGGHTKHIAQGTASMIEKQYSETLRTWARHLEPIVTNMYKEMYEEEDKKYFKSNIDKELQKTFPDLIQTLSDIRVIINFFQGLTTEEMNFGINRGWLPYKVAAQSWITQRGFPKELLVNDEDILSDAEKKELLLAMMGGKKKQNTGYKEDMGFSKGKSEKEEGEREKKRQKEEEKEEGGREKKRQKVGKQKEEEKTTKRKNKEEEKGKGKKK